MPGRRLLAAAAVAVASIIGLTIVLEHVRPAAELAASLLLFLAVVVMIAIIGGWVVGVATAAVSVPVIIWFIAQPRHSFEIDGRDLVSVIVFLVVAVAISVSIDLVNRRSAEARKARDESAGLALTAARAEAAAEGDRLRTAILRAVSHDLRTPLASIKASATSLLQDDVDWPEDARREFLVTIDEETDRLDRIVGDLLDMSRLDAGVVRPQSTPVDVGAAVRSAVAGVDRSSSAVTVDSCPRLLVAADEVMLERVIANLVLNGLRHGGGAVEVTARREGGDGVIEIVDHGPGIDPEHVEDVVRPFHREGDRTTGSGLGLAVARGFVDAMGGTLALGPTPGGGLTAIVRLPATDATPSRSDSIRRAPSRSTTTRPQALSR